MAEYQEVARQFKRMCDSQKWCNSCIINEKKEHLPVTDS